jgi:hypothetical protein
MLLAAICSVLGAGCTNTVSQVDREKKFVTMAVNVCEPSVGITGRITIVAHEILFKIDWVFM